VQPWAALSRKSAQHALDLRDPQTQVSEVSTTPFAVISEDAPMAAIIEMARSNPKATFLVANGGTIENVNEIRGIITSEQIMEALTHYYLENNTD
jgi:signal-transduction protein with cAMP-binding, CBS, and nucleotidyltransferase domain